MADDRLALDDVLEELRMLRHVVSEVINHCAGGGYVDRRGALFKDLRKVHRATRDRQTELKQIWPELPAAPWYREADPRYWQNLACCMAFFAGDRAWHLEGAWSVVLDSMLDAGGRETSLARSLAEILGIELRQSRDGGQTWYPVPTLRARLEEATDRELELELQRRGLRKRGSNALFDPPGGERLMLFGRVEVQHSPGVPDNLGVEFYLRRARDQTGGVIAAGTRDYQALQQHARQARNNSTLTFAGAPIRESDVLLNHEGLVADEPYQGNHRPRCDVDECDARAVDGTDFCAAHQPAVVHVVHDWLGSSAGGYVTLCGNGDGFAAWSATDQGAQVNCDDCLRRSRELRDVPRAEWGTAIRPVPGGVFGYMPKK